MEVCRFLSNEERAEVMRLLKEAKGILETVQNLIDPMSQGLDETPSIRKRETHATDVKTSDGVQRRTCGCCDTN
jgi:hypothetical protein